MIEAVVVDTRRRGPEQMAGATDLIDVATGGEYTRIMNRLDTLELALKVSIGASVVAGLAGLISIWRGR